MGVTGVFPFFGVKEANRTRIVDQTRGKRIGVDVSILVYQHVFKTLDYQQAQSLCHFLYTDNGRQHDLPVSFWSKLLDKGLGLIQKLADSYEAEIIVVLDGETPPSKQHTVDERKRASLQAYTDAVHHQMAHEVHKSDEAYKKAIRAPKEYLGLLARKAVEQGIQVVVAPFEADHQLLHMVACGDIAFIWSEDSDFIVYGGRQLQNFIVKPTINSGQGLVITSADIFCVHQHDTKRGTKLYDFTYWTHDQLLWLTCMVGNDYCRGLHGIALKKGYELMMKAGSNGMAVSNINDLLAFLSSARSTEHQKAELQSGQPDGLSFEDGVRRATFAMKHQAVYNVNQQAFVNRLSCGDADTTPDAVTEQWAGSPQTALERVTAAGASPHGYARGDMLPVPRCFADVAPSVVVMMTPTGMPTDNWYMDVDVLKKGYRVPFLDDLTCNHHFSQKTVSGTATPRGAGATLFKGAIRASSMHSAMLLDGGRKTSCRCPYSCPATAPPWKISKGIEKSLSKSIPNYRRVVGSTGQP
ncbi:DNA damage-inducible protein DIN7-like [Hyalella azteca]|uniref:DNA damage-inducible protein DIN7-like n=1 Tax=Hyalella azteca TaxID=294128 RepID=A0A8B7PCX3_HYAAZ|nr:DNA damage-inducible protein DIN7-like [Hyalella azteca]TDM04791.1 MAG: hypothetical protein C4K60_21550 [Ideonella sp. MAG2]